MPSISCRNPKLSKYFSATATFSGSALGNLRGSHILTSISRDIIGDMISFASVAPEKSLSSASLVRPIVRRFYHNKLSYQNVIEFVMHYLVYCYWTQQFTNCVF